MYVKHLAGIIPIAGQPLDFNFPWSDCLQPIGPDYLAVERAVLECAWAGCETIWIVCHDNAQPLIRARLGEYVQDPVYINRVYDSGPLSDNQKQIPIHYVPVHPKDRDRRDCLGWSVLYGANTAHFVCKKISKWVLPDKFYTAFPYGLYDFKFLREHRKDISSEQGFYVSWNGKTIKDGQYLGFTFTPEEFKEYRRHVRKTATGAYEKTDGEMPTEKLSLEERYSARYFSLDKVFGIGDTSGANVVSIPDYFNIDSWEGLRTYLGSDHRIYRHNTLLTAGKFNRIGEIDDRENEE
tara:strand:- start:185 stop:1069 length:885 start_codon:yes stop_codon:yes gene_type:complete